MKTLVIFLLLSLSGWAQNLVQASHTGQLPMVARMLSEGADPNLSYQGATPLLAACDGGHAEVVRLLLKAGAKPNSCEMTPLHVATHHGFADVARALLEGGANVNATNPQGITPLMLAASLGNTELARCLLKAGANPDLRNLDGANALAIARHRAHSEIVELLLKSGAH